MIAAIRGDHLTTNCCKDLLRIAVMVERVVARHSAEVYPADSSCKVRRWRITAVRCAWWSC